jgi:hypothetical protein
MQERADLLASAFIVGTLAAVALLGPIKMASAAAKCLENPDQQTGQPGQWHYSLDRTLNRGCWYFEPSEATANPPATASAPAANDASQQYPLSRFLSIFPSPQPQPQQNSVSDNSSEAAQTALPRPPKHHKTVRRERPRREEVPTTNGAASASDKQHDRPQLPVAAENTDKHDLPIDREKLFQDFMKWQIERNLFGRP